MFSKLIGLLLIISCSLTGLSQQNDHFIYLQSDTKLPFYVKLQGNPAPLISSGSGYLILPKVAQGAFSFTLGFPDSSYPEQHFICVITGDKDKGYLLKRFPEKGWALYDLQELTITYAGQTPTSVVDSSNNGAPSAVIPAAATPPATAPIVPVSSATQAAPIQTAPDNSSSTVMAAAPSTDTVSVPKVAATPKMAAVRDAFGDILVAVTHDSTLRDIKDNKKVAKPVADITPKVKDSAATQKALVTKTDSSIALVSRQSTDTGVQLVYTDRQASGSVDTVQVLIPLSSAATTGPVTIPVSRDSVISNGQSGVASNQAATVTDTAQRGKTTDTTQVFDPSSVQKQVKSKDTSNYIVPVFKQGGAQDTGSVTTASGNAAQPLAAGFGNLPASGGGAVLANTDCKRVAGDEDYARLRKKMTSESDVDRMIEIARKGFKKTCFTTDQIRNLSFLFLQEDGRYKFLEEAYPFASDSGNFKNLQTVFSSAYYINRFKALVQR